MENTLRETKVKHSENCTRVFKNYDKTCPRCIELMNGSKPREGWQKGYYENKRREEAQFIRQLKNHDCVESNCALSVQHLIGELIFIVYLRGVER